MDIGPVKSTVRRRRFEDLAAEVYEPVQRYVRRRVDRDGVNDVVSETMLTLWRRLDDVPPDARLPWVYGVARRQVANHRRAAGRQLRLVDALAADRIPTGITDASLDPELHTALGQLEDSDRDILHMWAWERLGPSQIAVVLGVTANAAAIRLHRAKKKLAEKLEAARKKETTSGHSHRESSREERS